MSKQTYDISIILGSKPNPLTWQFPSHVIASLNEAIQLFRQGIAPLIAVSGKWALSFDAKQSTPPFLEATAMELYLKAHGVSATSILREDQSEDTVANLYYLKRTILQPKHLTNVLFITADFRAKRLAYLAQKVLGPDYTVTINTVASAHGEPYHDEAGTFARTKHYLGPMTPGDDTFLDGMFYNHPFYTAKWPL